MTEIIEGIIGFVVLILLGLLGLGLAGNAYDWFQRHSQEAVDARWRTWLDQTPPAPPPKTDWAEFEAEVERMMRNERIGQDKAAKYARRLGVGILPKPDCQHENVAGFDSDNGIEYTCLDCGDKWLSGEPPPPEFQTILDL